MSSERNRKSLLETCIYLNRGITPSYVNDGGICVINQKCVRDESISLLPSRRTDISKKSIPKEKLLQTFDILINSTGQGTLGRVAQILKISEPTTVDSHLTILRPNSDVIDPFFLGCVVRNLQSQIEQLAEGSTGQTELSRVKLGNLEIDIPPRKEQVFISKTLRAIDDRIALLRETNATLEAIAQELFKSWFVDFDPVHAKQQGRLPEGMDEATAALFPDSFEESELGLVPRGWRVDMLGENTSYLNRGISPKYTEEDGGVLVINQKCIRNFILDFSKARKHDARIRKIEGRELCIGDVLVNSTGVGTLGRVAQVLSLNEPVIVDSHVTVIRAGIKLSWNYLGLAIMRRQSEIESFGEGTTGQTELSRSKLATIKLVIPAKAVLQKFDESTLSLRERFDANIKQSYTLAALRNILLPRLISGQLRIPEAETLVKGIA